MKKTIIIFILIMLGAISALTAFATQQIFVGIITFGLFYCWCGIFNCCYKLDYNREAPFKKQYIWIFLWPFNLFKDE